MNTEQTEILQRRAALHGALADVTRPRIVDLLAVSDRSATELGTALAIPSNLLARTTSGPRLRRPAHPSPLRR